MNEEKKNEAENQATPEQKNNKPAITVNSDMAPEQNPQDKLRLPVLAMGRTTVFPYGLTPLMISDEDTIRTLEYAMEKDRLAAIFPEMPNMETERGIFPPAAQGIEFKVSVWQLNKKQVAGVGVMVRVIKMLKFPDNTVRLLVRGISRVQMERCLKTDHGPEAEVHKVEYKIPNTVETVAMIRNATKSFHELVSQYPNFPEELKISVINMTDPGRVADLIADTINFSYIEKLALLTIEDYHERLNLLLILLNREVEIQQMGNSIQQNVQATMNRNQRDFFLREQIKEIRKELGEGSMAPDIVEFTQRMEKLSLPPEVVKVIQKELERLEVIPQMAPEYNIAYTYVDWLLNIPWSDFTHDRIDVKEAEQILDHDHYGLQDVKERILEFLAVLQLKTEKKSPIICFVGPPGVGKTSLGKSIASSMGRKFVRVSLGGVSDEAEIRGHRRTYVGAMPGRIIQGMKKAGSSNPVFMLDEIDKLGTDRRGDPASALLEVLDPQQNVAFNDHYLEVDYDLSPVMFIATANVEEAIPGPLRDRMEIIRLPGYTAFEKHEIARRYLIPRQMKENGLKSGDITFTRGAVDDVITHYTMEAGVRNLERTFGKLCRKVARKIVEGSITPGEKYLIDAGKVPTILGAYRFTEDPSESAPRVGVVTGLAWTSVGGVTLPVEAAKMPGKGDLRLTGSLGDVMKESAYAAFSFVRGHADELGIEQDVFQKYDFHIHVPDGATPKDGPSAGVTIVTALVSLLTGRYVRPKIAMTGEITLRGLVTPIGGVREKVIAAIRAGVQDVILPAANEKDLEEIPADICNCVRYHFMSEIMPLLEYAVPKKAVKAEKPKKESRKNNPDEVYEFELPEESASGEKQEGKTETASSPAEQVPPAFADFEEMMSRFSSGKAHPISELPEDFKQHLIKILRAQGKEIPDDTELIGEFACVSTPEEMEEIRKNFLAQAEEKLPEKVAGVRAEIPAEILEALLGKKSADLGIPSERYSVEQFMQDLENAKRLKDAELAEDGEPDAAPVAVIPEGPAVAEEKKDPAKKRSHRITGNIPMDLSISVNGKKKSPEKEPETEEPVKAVRKPRTLKRKKKETAPVAETTKKAKKEKKK